MKFMNILAVVALMLAVSPTSLGNPPNLKSKKIIVELTIPDFGDASRIEIPKKKNFPVLGGGGRGMSHPTPEELKAIKVWSYSYNILFLKQTKAVAIIDFSLSWEGNGEHSINRRIEIKSGEVTEIEFQDEIKLKAYFKGDM
jgi:hypothetical protein